MIFLLQFHYSGSSPHRNVPFEITWGAVNAKPLDNPDIIQGNFISIFSNVLRLGRQEGVITPILLNPL